LSDERKKDCVYSLLIESFITYVCDNIRTLYVLSIIQTEPQHTIITCDPHRTNQSYQSILLRGIHICSKTSILRN
jgi:hypothetical protein